MASGGCILIEDFEAFKLEKNDLDASLPCLGADVGDVGEVGKGGSDVKVGDVGISLAPWESSREVAGKIGSSPESFTLKLASEVNSSRQCGLLGEFERRVSLEAGERAELLKDGTGFGMARDNEADFGIFPAPEDRRMTL